MGRPLAALSIVAVALARIDLASGRATVTGIVAFPATLRGLPA